MNDPQLEEASIEVLLDGQTQRLKAGSTLADLVALREQEAGAVATAVNGQFVPRTQRDRLLQQGDQVLVFRAITGG